MATLRTPDIRHQGNRSITLVWRSGEITPDGETCVELEASHRQDRRALAATLRVVHLDGVWWRFSSDDPSIVVTTRPVQRYSSKALEQLLEDARMVVQDHLEDDDVRSLMGRASAVIG